MSTIEKLLARLRRNPKAARYDDVVRLLASIGWAEVRTRGSHVRFESADGDVALVVVRPHGREPYCAYADVMIVLAIVEQVHERRKQRNDG